MQGDCLAFQIGVTIYGSITRTAVGVVLNLILGIIVIRCPVPVGILSPQGVEGGVLHSAPQRWYRVFPASLIDGYMGAYRQ